MIDKPQVKRTVNIRRIKPFHRVYESSTMSESAGDGWSRGPAGGRSVDTEESEGYGLSEDNSGDDSDPSEYHPDEDESSYDDSDPSDYSPDEEPLGEVEPQSPRNRVPPEPVPGGVQLRTGRVSRPPLSILIDNKFLFS